MKPFGERWPDCRRQYRLGLTLCEQENTTVADMGKAMERSPNAARMLWVRAQKRLEHELKRG